MVLTQYKQQQQQQEEEEEEEEGERAACGWGVGMCTTASA
jgi:hypothetical protein